MLRHAAPAELREGTEDNLRTLGVEKFAAVNLRVMSNDAPDDRFLDQLGAMVQAGENGLIAGVGLSHITTDRLHLRENLAAGALSPRRRGRGAPDGSVQNRCTVRFSMALESMS